MRIISRHEEFLVENDDGQLLRRMQTNDEFGKVVNVWIPEGHFTTPRDRKLDSYMRELEAKFRTELENMKFIRSDAP